MTKSAIVRFQRRRGLAVDGVVGPQTRRAFGKRGRPAFGSRTMKRGDRGWDVAAMQYILARRGYPPGAIDAVFGPMTDTALRNFQRALGLSADGLAGPATISALRRGPIEGHDAGGGRAGAAAAAGAGPDRRPLRRSPEGRPHAHGNRLSRTGRHTGGRRGRRRDGIRRLELGRLRQPRGGPPPARLHHLVRTPVRDHDVCGRAGDGRHTAWLRGLDRPRHRARICTSSCARTPCRWIRCRICCRRWRRGRARRVAAALRTAARGWAGRPQRRRRGRDASARSASRSSGTRAPSSTPAARRI